MTLKEHLHRSATHKLGKDPACPMCYPLTLNSVIADLKRNAEQNEKDEYRSAGIFHIDSAQAGSVAREQRRMIAILERLKRQGRQ